MCELGMGFSQALFQGVLIVVVGKTKRKKKVARRLR